MSVSEESFNEKYWETKEHVNVPWIFQKGAHKTQKTRWDRNMLILLWHFINHETYGTPCQNNVFNTLKEKLEKSTRCFMFYQTFSDWNLFFLLFICAIYFYLYSYSFFISLKCYVFFILFNYNYLLLLLNCLTSWLEKLLKLKVFFSSFSILFIYLYSDIKKLEFHPVFIGFSNLRKQTKIYVRSLFYTCKYKDR